MISQKKYGWHEQWNGEAIEMGKPLKWRGPRHGGDSTKAWTVEWRGQGNDVDSGAFVFTIPKSTLWPHRHHISCFVSRQNK